ncbi:MAG: hypothetical protein C0485_06035 [Pirellula sp.]|nr:hypothetical protein [Pirellula sp.]
MNVMRPKSSKCDLADLGLAIAIHVLEVQNLRRRRDEDAAVVAEDRRRPAKSVGVDRAPLEAAVMVGVFEQADPTNPVVRVLAVAEHFHDEESPMFVEVDGHRIGDLRLNGGLFEGETKLHFERLGGLCRTQRGDPRQVGRVIAVDGIGRGGLGSDQRPRGTMNNRQEHSPRDDNFRVKCIHHAR